MNLTATDQSLELVTTAATQIAFEVSWTDIDKSGASTITLPGSNQGFITSATTTVVVPAPPSDVYRNISTIAVKAPGGAQTVTVQKDAGGLHYPGIIAALQITESLHYGRGAGWYVMNSIGARKVVGSDGAPGINGGGTILGSGTSILDFGAGSSHASLVVTGQSLVVAGSLVYVWVKPEATATHTADEHMVETLKVHASDVVAGVGFTIHGFNTSQLAEPVLPNDSLRGRFSGAGTAPGAGQAARINTRVVGGMGTKITGQWSIGWMFTQ